MDLIIREENKVDLGDVCLELIKQMIKNGLVNKDDIQRILCTR